MRHAEGAFFSSEDADSEGEEGRFFVWTEAEIEAALPPAEAAALREAYDVTTRGNFEGRNILHLVREPKNEKEAVLLAAARQHLAAIRQERVRPGRDDKILASWNGLALAAFADAARVFGSRRYADAASACADFLLDRMVRTGWRMAHSWKDGEASEVGFLEDHALVACGLLALYEATYEERWYAAAKGLLDALAQHFARDGGGFYDTSADHEALISRPRSLADTPLPSGNAAACMGFLKLAAYSGDSHYLDLVEKTLTGVDGLLTRAPSAFAHSLSVHYLATRGLRELAVVGEIDDEKTTLLLKVASATYRPDLVVGMKAPGVPTSIPLLQDREPVLAQASASELSSPGPGDPPPPATAWLCRRSACLPPVNEAGLLQELLADV